MKKMFLKSLTKKIYRDKITMYFMKNILDKMFGIGKLFIKIKGIII